jgi:hypothetical protein
MGASAGQAASETGSQDRKRLISLVMPVHNEEAKKKICLTRDGGFRATLENVSQLRDGRAAQHNISSMANLLDTSNKLGWH